MERLAVFAASKLGKWIIGAATVALGAFLTTLVNSVGDLGFSAEISLLIGSMLGSIAGRLGIPSPPKDGGVRDAV